MKDKKVKEVKEYITANVKLNTLVSKLEELKQEKEEILSLASLDNPPVDILDRMDKNAVEYKKLLDASEKFKKETTALNKN